MRTIAMLAIALAAFPAFAKNPYSDFYTDATDGVTPALVDGPPQPEPYSHGADIDMDMHRMFQQGYVLLGSSSFNSGDYVSEKKALKQAEDVRAHIVLMGSRHTDTRTVSAPIFLPNTQTSTSTSSGTIYGPFGTSQYQGQTTTRTPGTQVINRTRTIDRYDYFASYWAKGVPGKFGAQLQDLTPDQRWDLGRNRGAMIKVIVDGSPAFRADVLEGDVVLAIRGEEIVDTSDFISRTRALAGESVTITVWRKGTTLEREVQLNP